MKKSVGEETAFTKARGEVPCQTDEDGDTTIEIMVAAISNGATIIIGKSGKWFGLTREQAVQLSDELLESILMVPTTREARDREYEDWFATHGSKFKKALTGEES